MPNTINSDILFILIAVLVGSILGFLIGWTMKSMKSTPNKTTSDVNNKKIEKGIKKPESKSVKKEIKKEEPKKIVAKEKKPEIKKEKVAQAVTEKKSQPVSNTSEKIIPNNTAKENNLEIVQGIDSNIADLLNKDGISTWKHLGDAPVIRLQKILNEGGESFQSVKPDSWSQQSKLANEGKWEELKKFQASLNS